MMETKIPIVATILALAFAPSACCATNHTTTVTNLFREASVLFDSKEYARALALFGQVLSTVSNSAVALPSAVGIGDCHFAIGEYQKAIQAYERCLKDYPSGSVRFNVPVKVGDCYVRLNDLDRARVYYKAWPRMVPDVEKRIQMMKEPQPPPAN